MQSNIAIDIKTNFEDLKKCIYFSLQLGKFTDIYNCQLLLMFITVKIIFGNFST